MELLDDRALNTMLVLNLNGHHEYGANRNFHVIDRWFCSTTIRFLRHSNKFADIAIVLFFELT